MKNNRTASAGNSYIIRGSAAEYFIASRLEDNFLFARDENFTSLFKCKIRRLAGQGHHIKFLLVIVEVNRFNHAYKQ